MAVFIFVIFVVFVISLSFYLGNKAKSASGYFAAGGQIHWIVNGIAFAGDYLSAASFLGICGMIATLGYDGFLYSIGYLAGWIVALFVVAEPLKKLGKFTFADALDAKFNSSGIQLAAAISTLVVSIFYLIPQMVGAGTLVTPLLHLDHHWGVILVGVIVITIVATAGMASTTYVQFIKGAMLIIFSTILVISVLYKGINLVPPAIDQAGNITEFYKYKILDAQETNNIIIPVDNSYTFISQKKIIDTKTKKIQSEFVKLSKNYPLILKDNHFQFNYMGINVSLPEDATEKLKNLSLEQSEQIININNTKYIHKTINGEKVLVLYEGRSEIIDGLRCVMQDGKLFAKIENWWKKENIDGKIKLIEAQTVSVRPNEAVMINGAPASFINQLRTVGTLEAISGNTSPDYKIDKTNPIIFLAILSDDKTIFNQWKSTKFNDGNAQITAYYPKQIKGSAVMRPGQFFKIESSWKEKIDFISLMLALFLGTASLPHILIRYYTVPNPSAARKSTIVAIAAIGFFYILTLYMGLGAAINNVLNPADSNMSAPLLAKSIGMTIFAIISALAFATVLGTVSGLIIAASGAVAHDLLDRFSNLKMSEKQKVNVGKLAAFTVGFIAIILGIIFKSVNVSFLVGLAFAVAASANLPSIVMLLFWKKTTAAGIIASIIVGVTLSVGLILFSPVMYALYGLPIENAPIQLKSPAIISVPLSFLALIIVSLLTQKKIEK